MSQRTLRQKPRISYCEPVEPNLDEYLFCEKCCDYVYEYCSIHGPLLVVPDDKVPAKPDVPWYVPRAALTIPRVFLHIHYSIIPDAGLGVFSSMTLPSGVRFGPYRGERTDVVDSSYCWQIYDNNRKPVHCIDAADANKSNWMRYVNCARHWREQNLVAYQYQGELYYRTIKIIPRFTELMVFYGSEFACELDVDLSKYNSPTGYAQKFGAPVAKKRKSNNVDNAKTEEKEPIKLNRAKSSEDTQSAINVGSKTQDPVESKANVDGQITKNVKKSVTPTAKAKKKFVNRKLTKTSLKINKTKNENEKVQTNLKDVGKPVNNLSLDVTASLDIPKTKVQDPYVYCEHCKKRCINNIELQKHLRFHDLNRNYECEFCKLRYTSSNSLNIHVNKHTKVKKFICKICDSQFYQNSKLKNHMRIHTEEKPYACEICDYKCNERTNLNNHMRIHTREKPYACEICDYKCNQSTDLKKHLRTHTGEKPYACEVCDYKCTVSTSLKTHMRIHTGEKPYACEICDFKCKQSIHLKYHMGIHTGEKPYACEICDYKCTVSTSLKTHMRIHTGEKPFACEICDYKCNQSGSLKKHLLKHIK